MDVAQQRSEYTFSVFTPTHNRATTLPGCYESLAGQTFKDFEWLVVDDGSEDDTGDLVASWQASADFPIRYIPLPHGGKHRAFNRAVAEARGAFFLTLDSDDTCRPNALERFLHHWEQIPPEERDRFAGVTVLCGDASGAVVGDKFPSDVFDSNYAEVHDRFGVSGDNWGFQRTDVLREHPFPEFENELFVTEGLVWNRIARAYTTRYVNEVLRTYELSPDSLTRRSVAMRVASPRGTALYYRERLHTAETLKAQFKAAANYLRYRLHEDTSLPTAVRDSGRPLFAVVAAPVAYLLTVRDRDLVPRPARNT